MVSTVIRSVHSYSKVNSLFFIVRPFCLFLRLLFYELFYIFFRYKLNSHCKFMLPSVAIDTILHAIKAYP